MVDTVDPDERADSEPSYLDIQCLQIQPLLCFDSSMVEFGHSKHLDPKI